MHLKSFIVSAVVLGCLTLSGIAWGQVYYVQPGDSLYNIAARYGTSVSTLVQSNGLRNGSIYPGQALQVIPGGTNPATGSSYTVRPGDTLFLVAQRFGVSVDSLKRTNYLSGNDLQIGQRLSIPAVSISSSPNTNYRVQPGDTLYLIAQRNGVTVEALTRANNISSYGSIYPGQNLSIPKSVSASGSNSYSVNLSQSDMNLLARLVFAESSGEPFEGQVAVAATILNRLQDPRYPKTIAGIIYQIDNGRYQYSPVLDGRINQAASPSAYRAVQAACSGWDPSNGANGFYNPAGTTNQWVRSHPQTASIGNHVFFNY